MHRLTGGGGGAVFDMFDLFFLHFYFWPDLKVADNGGSNFTYAQTHRVFKCHLKGSNVTCWVTVHLVAIVDFELYPSQVARRLAAHKVPLKWLAQYLRCTLHACAPSHKYPCKLHPFVIDRTRVPREEMC